MSKLYEFCFTNILPVARYLRTVITIMTNTSIGLKLMRKHTKLHKYAVHVVGTMKLYEATRHNE